MTARVPGDRTGFAMTARVPGDGTGFAMTAGMREL
jgi:hypothetical protein